MAKKVSKKKAESSKLQKIAKKDGYRLPHGYEVVIRKKK